MLNLNADGAAGALRGFCVATCLMASMLQPTSHVYNIFAQRVHVRGTQFAYRLELVPNVVISCLAA